jgi:rhombotarget A family protien
LDTLINLNYQVFTESIKKISDMEVKKYANVECAFMFKHLVSLGLLCFALDAHASITVNTTADTSGSSACSLRDAVAMVNSGTLATNIGGCKDSDTSAVVVLTVGQVYTLNSEIQLNNSITFQSSDTGDLSGTAGTNNPTVRAVGNHRIFSINPNGTATTVVPSVTITGVDLQGCGGPAICDSNGGVIFNKGLLSISTSRIYNGFATLGGGIYNENTGRVSATIVELKDNTAQQGAAVYSIAAAVQMTQSLIRENQIANPTEPGFAIYTQSADPTLTTYSGGVTSSTIYNNNANAINVVPGIVVNSTTIVGNHGGVTLNASIQSALANSIIGGNNGADCTFLSGDLTPINNVAYTNSCGSSAGASTSNTLLSNTGTQTLIAADTSGNGSGQCALPPANGLLCPFATYSGHFTGYLLPRLVPALGATLASSPIINKGFNGGTGLACASDQRGNPRTLCDIGAIELIVPTGNAQSNGQDILYGDVSKIDLSPVVGDGQLIPAALCTSLFGDAPTSQGGVWMDGCINYSMLNGVAPTKGTAVFNAVTNMLTYTPTSNFHGFDKFTYTMATTTSFFSDAQNNKTITVTTTIVQSPPTGITSKTVGAGGIGIFVILGLMGLALRRRLTGVQL